MKTLFQGGLIRTLFVTPFLVLTLGLPSFAADSSRERLSLDSAWFFNPGDIPFPVIKGHGASYSNAKAGKAWGATAFTPSKSQTDLQHFRKRDG